MSLVLDAVWSNLRDRPFNLEFGVTKNCNSRCEMCNRWKTKTKDELSVEEISKIFKSYPHFKVVGITGGEPTLREDLSDIVAEIIRTQRKLKRIFITTNGFLTDKLGKDVQEILSMLSSKPKINLTVLISIDGPQTLHNKIRGKPDAYGCAKNSIMRLSRYARYNRQLTVGAIATYSPYNYQNYNEVLREITYLSLMYDLESAICFVWNGNLYDSVEQPFDDTYMKMLPYYIPHIKKCLEVTNTTLIDARVLFYQLGFEFVQNPRKQVIPCGGARIRYYMDSHGKVYPCVVWNEEVGDLRKMDYNFPALIASAKRKKIRGLVEKEKCGICYLTCELIPSMMSHPLQLLWKIAQ